MKDTFARYLESIKSSFRKKQLPSVTVRVGLPTVFHQKIKRIDQRGFFTRSFHNIKDFFALRGKR